MNPATNPKERVRVFNRAGVELAQFRATVKRSWTIGAEGRASMVLASRKTNYVNDTVLRFGNWLLVENDSLPHWVGVIDTPREWSARQVTVNAFTPERVFSQRIGSLEQKISGPAGSIFVALINRVLSQEMTLLRSGNIWTGGDPREIVLHPYPLSQALSTLQKQSGEEYSFRPSITVSGTLIVFCDWLDKLGIVTNVPLIEGKAGGNIENSGVYMVEDGTIYNNVLGYGPGSAWASRPNKENLATDNSLAQYGLRQTSKDYGSVSSVDVINRGNIGLMRRSSQPVKNFSVTALNRGDTFKYIRLGNRLELSLQSVGFTGSGLGLKTYIRILGMYYDPAEGQKIKLVLQETS